MGVTSRGMPKLGRAGAHPMVRGALAAWPLRRQYWALASLSRSLNVIEPAAGSGVVRIDPLRFLAYDFLLIGNHGGGLTCVSSDD